MKWDGNFYINIYKNNIDLDNLIFKSIQDLLQIKNLKNKIFMRYQYQLF